MICDSFLLPLVGKIGEVDFLGEQHSIETFIDGQGASLSRLFSIGLVLTCLGFDERYFRLTYLDL